MNCGVAGSQFTSPGRLITEQGWSLKYPNGRQQTPERELVVGPSALRIETLAEEGAPIVDLDNSAPIRKVEGCGGCSAVSPLGLGLVALLAGLRRRRGN